MNDEVVLGDTEPKLEGVIGTTFYYKGLSVGCYFRYSLGAQIFNSALFQKVENIGTADVFNNQDKRALYDRWSPNNTEAYFKGISLTQKTDKYDLPPETQELIVMASALHDIGKVAIDDKILNKPGRLTPEEFDLMKTHTVVGANMLDHLGRYKNEALVKTAHDICRWHHERWDGRGYPDGLAGDDIPISAQIVSMADVYDALVSKRVYKAAYSPDTAVQMILHGDCGQFNPLLLECLVEIQDVLKAEIVGRENEDS